MSRIKRLKLKGFKSFANPIVLNFENGFNTIVGANGSGKSNVFDALCFVLGRMSSKGLRADKLGNLVFNGGKTTSPAKEAEVAIYLSNDDKELLNIDLDEVKISRVVSKKGSSDYFLNNNKSTRTEIVEVLKRASIDPDGYNIILQGDIMKIVNMTPNERRELIEEIANISNYEEKRQASLKKLEGVELDLKNADLLLDEKTKYIRELKSEKDAAERYHKVKEELRFNSLLLVKSKLIRNVTLKKNKEEELLKQEEELKFYKDKLAGFEEEEKAINVKLTELEKSIEIQSHKNFIEVTNKITALEAEIQKLKERKAETKKQVEEVKTKNVGIKENIKKNNEEIKRIDLVNKELEKSKKELEKQISDVEGELSKLKKNISSESFVEIDKIDVLIEELNEKKFSKTQIRQDNAIQIEKLNARIEMYEEDLKKIELNKSENKTQVEQLDKARKRLKQIIIDISKYSSSNSETAAKLNNLQKEYSNLVEDHSKLRIQADRARDLISSNKAVEAILKLKSHDSSIHGTVAELASVPSKYSFALESIAGKNLFNIVVDNDTGAVKYINFLKEKKIGNATFLPLNKVNTKFRLDDSVLNKKGVIDYALNLIKFDKRYENIFHLVFQDTLVIEKIEDAKGIGIGEYKMVSLDGDLAMKTGAMSGGFKQRNSSSGVFKDEKLIEKLEGLEKRMSTISNTIEHLKEEKEESEKKIYDLRQERVDIEGDISKLEKILSIEGKDLDSIKREVENILGDKTVIESSLKKIDREINQLNEEIKGFQEKKLKLKGSSNGNSNIMVDINKLEEQRDKFKENLMKLNSNLSSNDIQIRNVLNPEIVNLNKILVEGNEAIERMQKIISDIDLDLTNLIEDLKINQAKEKELSKDYKDFIASRDKLKEDKKKIEEKYNKEFEKFDKVKEKVAQLNYAISEFGTMTKTLQEELELLYEQIKVEFIAEEQEISEKENAKLMDLVKSVEDALENKSLDVKELQNKVNNLKTRLNSFGSINLKAVQVYDQLKAEFDILIEKRGSLNIEKADILKLVAEMDEKKKEKFLQTFEQLKTNFARIFATLSTKGDAELIIEDEKNLFENGVEIRVKMTAKNILDIKSLSGGEKTITAIAFIFAVQEFNPASFYIFDEVDAALDIMNAEKLGKLIRDYSKNAQYIVVSHSEHLIQSAEIIYGVTMDKYKISDVVSLDLRDATEYVDTAETKS